MRQRPDDLAVSDDAPDPETFDIGVGSESITTVVDVRAHVKQKRAAMAAHASQIAEHSFFLQLPDDAFELAFGLEWFIRYGEEPSAQEHSVFDGLTSGRSGAAGG